MAGEHLTASYYSKLLLLKAQRLAEAEEPSVPVQERLAEAAADQTTIHQAVGHIVDILTAIKGYHPPIQRAREAAIHHEQGDIEIEGRRFSIYHIAELRWGKLDLTDWERRCKQCYLVANPWERALMTLIRRAPAVIQGCDYEKIGLFVDPQIVLLDDGGVPRQIVKTVDFITNHDIILDGITEILDYPPKVSRKLYRVSDYI